MAMKPIPSSFIQECGESLVAIPSDRFSLFDPHPYRQLGAPYGKLSPFCLREGVLAALYQAQEQLKQLYPQWQLKIFDAYRPLAVQRFMVEYTFTSLVREQGLNEASLSPQEQTQIQSQVRQFWAEPSWDPATPPPHSTGAAIDLTLADERGQPLDLGGAIDELSPRSFPDCYANCSEPMAKVYHARRSLLAKVMIEAGFCQHSGEWWHFSLGDRAWAQQNNCHARYGRVE